MWTRCGAFDALGSGEHTVWKAPGGARMVVGRTADGAPFALDDACPHEGYPLSKGSLSGGLLTCVWHNFKFDVATGACVKGDEPVAAWPVRVQDGGVSIDLTPPDPGARRARTWASLERCVREGRTGGAVRDAVRLLASGVPAEDLLRWTAAYDARYAEDGLTHLLAFSSVAARLLVRRSGVEAAIVVAQPLDLACLTLAWRPDRVTGLAGRAGTLADLPALVEAEAEADAVETVRVLARSGAPLEELRGVFVRIATAHLLSFGHGLIYVHHAFDLLPADPQTTEIILVGLVRALVRGTREEEVPEWSAWRRRVIGPVADVPPRGVDGALATAVGESRHGREIDAVQASLATRHPLDVADALVVAAADRLLRFDVAIDRDPTVQDGWLDITHRFTYAVALRRALATVDGLDAERLLTQAAHWINRARPADGPGPTPSKRPGDVMAAVRAGDAEAAVAYALATPFEAFRAAFEDYVLTDPWPVPIAAAHLLKTTLAAGEAVAFLPPELAARVVAGAVRFAACPPAQRFLERRVHDATELVLHGRVPRLLTG